MRKRTRALVTLTLCALVPSAYVSGLHRGTEHGKSVPTYADVPSCWTERDNTEAVSYSFYCGTAREADVPTFVRFVSVTPSALVTSVRTHANGDEHNADTYVSGTEDD